MKKLTKLFLIIGILIAILLAAIIPISSKTVECRVDGRYSILLGQKQAYDTTHSYIPGPTEGVCAPAGTLRLYLL